MGNAIIGGILFALLGVVRCMLMPMLSGPFIFIGTGPVIGGIPIGMGVMGGCG